MEEAVNLSTVIDQVCREKNISRDVLVETMEQAVQAAAKKVFEEREIEATFDEETGMVNLFQVLEIVHCQIFALRHQDSSFHNIA